MEKIGRLRFEHRIATGGRKTAKWQELRDAQTAQLLREGRKAARRTLAPAEGG